jgi:hypothetical protein
VRQASDLSAHHGNCAATHVFASARIATVSSSEAGPNRVRVAGRNGSSLVRVVSELSVARTTASGECEEHQEGQAVNTFHVFYIEQGRCQRGPQGGVCFSTRIRTPLGRRLGNPLKKLHKPTHNSDTPLWSQSLAFSSTCVYLSVHLRCVCASLSPA